MTNQSVNSSPKTPGEIWLIRDILNWTTKKFSELLISTPLLDAQLLLCKALKISKIELYMQLEKPLSEQERKDIRDLVKRRINGEPVAYILQQKYWHDLDLFVDKRVLIPRPETETLFDFVLMMTETEYKKQGKFFATAEDSKSESDKSHNMDEDFSELPAENLTDSIVELSNNCESKNDAVSNQSIEKIEHKIIFDLCTGSGCLAISLARKFPQAKVIAVDLMQNAIEVAKINADKYDCSNIEFMQFDLSNPDFYEYCAANKYYPSIIVANPPYVTEEEFNTLDVSVRNFEPKEALVADENGLHIANLIMQNLFNFELMQNCKVFAMELSKGHPAKVAQKYNLSFADISYSFPVTKQHLNLNTYFTLKDLAGVGRFLCFIK